MRTTNEEREYYRLLREYSELRDYFLDENMGEVFYDAMLYDIEGYNSVGEDEILSFLPELKKQVNGFKLIKRGLEKIDYTFS